MHHYYTNRGLDSVERLAKIFKDRVWYLPELICPEVIDKINEFVSQILYYTVSTDLECQYHLYDEHPKVIYQIDYFGRKHVKRSLPNTYYNPSNAVIIRDCVWFPHPFDEIKHNEIWFNSLRKIFRGAKGSSIVSHYRLGNDEINNVYNHPMLTWREVDTRFRNFYFCRKHMSEFDIGSFIPEFPTVFPFRLKNRDKVLEAAGLKDVTPGMWEDKYHLEHPLYNDLTFIPIDSRFNEDQLAEKIEKIRNASKE